MLKDSVPYCEKERNRRGTQAYMMGIMTIFPAEQVP
jgi:hypothetical protein